MLRGWLVYNMTGSATNLGLISLAAGVPLVLISFFGGVVADRVDRLKFLLVTQVMAGLISLITGILIATKLIAVLAFYCAGNAPGNYLCLYRSFKTINYRQVGEAR